MLHKIFVVRDAKVEAYAKPIFVRSRGEGLRSFTDAVNDNTTEFARHPEDYALFEIGVYDDDTGLVEPHVQPELIAKAVDLVIAS